MKHEINDVKLKNGAKGLLINVDHAPVMGFEFNFRAGDYLSPDKKWEVAHLMEHLVLGANESYPKARLFHAEFQKNGAYSNASTSAYNLNYIAECADFEWDRILEMMLQSIDSPLFLDEEFNAESGNVREELTGDLSQHFRQMLILSREKFGLVALADEERLKQIDNIKIADIKNHYDSTHTTDNLRFIIAGELDGRQDKVLEMIEGINLKGGERIDLPDETPNSFNDVFYLERPGLQNMYFLWHTLRNHQFTQEEEDALGLLNVMLTATLHSKILGEARERGLVYDLSSHYSKFKGLSDWYFGAEVMKENIEEVFEIMTSELIKVKKGDIDDGDVEAARQYALGRYQRSVQTVRGLIQGYSNSFFLDDQVDDYYQVPKRLNAVTKKSMIDIAQNMFEENIWGLTVLGTDKQEIAKRLNKQLSVLWS